MKIIFRLNEQRIVATGETLDEVISNLPEYMRKYTAERKSDTILTQNIINSIGRLTEFLEDEYGAIIEYAVNDECCGNSCGCG